MNWHDRRSFVAEAPKATKTVMIIETIGTTIVIHKNMKIIKRWKEPAKGSDMNLGEP
jgi:hypothetical protein